MLILPSQNIRPVYAHRSLQIADEEKRERLNKFGLSIWVAVGIHPRSIPNEGTKKVLDNLLALPKVAPHLDRAGFGARDIELVTRSNIGTLLPH